MARANLLTISLFLPFALLLAGCGGSQKDRVVLYCAQDEEFAEAILRNFHNRTGLQVDTKFDTEADKSVSLYTELIHEKSRPRCDVHWNNEILATIRLQRQGLLEPYTPDSALSYPATAWAKDFTWHAFAARARIILVNTQLVKDAYRPHGLLDLADPRWRGRVAMAKPQYGTSATQATCLFEVMGPENAKNFYLALRNNGIHI